MPKTAEWTCLWSLTPLACQKDLPLAQQDCAWSKVWKCKWLQIPRCDVLKSFGSRRAPRCPWPNGPGECYSGETECFVPADTYFARVYEIEYEECVTPENAYAPGDTGYVGTCKPQGISDMGALGPASRDAAGNCGACCGVFEVCVPRYVRIHCRDDIPPELPYEVPLPFYERPSAPRSCMRNAPACAGGSCRVGSNATKSPSFWLDQARLYA